LLASLPYLTRKFSNFLPLLTISRPRILSRSQSQLARQSAAEYSTASASPESLSEQSGAVCVRDYTLRISGFAARIRYEEAGSADKRGQMPKAIDE